MKILPLSEAKAKLSALVDEVRATDEEVVITKNGRAAAVSHQPRRQEGDDRDSWRRGIDARYQGRARGAQGREG